MAMLGLGYLTRYCGMDATMGMALAHTGAAFPFFGTMIGWLGVALSGTDAGSNALFGSLQMITANKLGLSPILMGAANSAGGVMGKMIAAQSLVIGCAVTGQQGQEGALFRAVMKHSIGLLILVGLLVLMYAYVFPGAIPNGHHYLVRRMNMTNRRDFGKMALGGTLGALLAASRSGRATVHPSAPGIKLCAQSGATPTDDQLLFLKQIGAEYVSVGSTPDLRTAEGFLQIKKRYADAGITVWNIGNTSVHNMPEVTLNLPGRDQKDRGVQAVPSQSGQGGDLLHHLRPHGQRHLEQRARHHPRRIGPGIRHGQPRQAGRLGRQDLEGAAVARTRVHQGRNLGELHLLHQAGGAGRRGSGRAHRHPSRRSAGPRAGRRAALHLQQLRRLQAGAGDRQQPQRRHLPVLRHAGWRAARSSPARIPRR